MPHIRPEAVLGLIIALSYGYHLLALYEVRSFGGSGDDEAVGDLPPVSLLKPLTGWDEQIHDNLKTFCDQYYPAYHLLAGIPDSGALHAASSVIADEHCATPVQWALCNPRLATNPKVSQLRHLYPHTPHDILILSDADIRVDAQYIRQVIVPFADPRVGVVTCLYAARAASTSAALLEALTINIDFIPSVLVGRRLFGTKYALGATIAVRRSVIEAIGGFEALADYLADDYQLGLRARRAGYRVVIADYIVENQLSALSLRDLYHHQVRWARTIRVNQPVGWFFSIITHITIWSALAFIVSGFSPRGGLLLASALLFRALAGYAVNRRLDGLPSYRRAVWLLPFKELFSFAMWLLSFTGRRVRWAGRVYVVAADGRMREFTTRR